MYLNDFSMRIPEGKEVPGGYVELEHDTQYTLNLRNNRNTRCKADVYIDGKNVGSFRLNAHETMKLERPVHDDGLFTFYKLGTSEAGAAGLEDSPDIGLVRVVFAPELARQKWCFPPQPIEPWPKEPWKPWSPYPYPYWTTCESNNVTFTSRAVCNSAPVAMAASAPSAGGTGLSGKSGQVFTNVPDLVLDMSQQTTINLRLVCKGADGPRPLTAFSTPVPPKV